MEGTVYVAGSLAFEVLHTPGHSPGGIALFERTTGLLFSGDVVYDGQLLDDLPGSDLAAYGRSMRRLLALPVRTVHGGHGPSMGPERFREVIRGWLEARGLDG
jgi:glyoxylase-like metal-dependent hydrolase (beta-lactamase superfamily II)